jgi:CubicO group peptidase (beta-lactamase class C family)
MKRFAVRYLLALSLQGSLLSALYAQPAAPRTDSVAQLIAGYMKTANWKAVYALTDSVFRSRVTESMFTAQMLQLQRTAFGNFIEIRYVRRNGNIHYYKAYFDEAQMLMVLGCTEADSVNTLAFRRYYVPGQDTAVRSNNPLRSALDRKVDSVVRNWLKLSYHAGISIGIYDNGTRMYYGYGETQPGNAQIPGPHSLYEIGSITKTFTGILLALQYETGAMHPDTCISYWLPDSLPPMQWNNKPVTASMLSNHTSGLPPLPLNFKMRKGFDASNPYKGYTDTLLYGYFTSFKPYREPGKNFEYSNMGVGLLGLILQRRFNNNYDALVRKYITGPLNMTRTAQYPQRMRKVNYTTPHNGTGDVVQHWTFESAFAAAGALHSTAADMLTYAAFVMRPANNLLGAAVKRSVQPTFTIAAGRKIGLGWMLLQSNDNEYITHSGGTGGYRSTLLLHAPSGKAVVVLTNTGNEVESIALQLLNYLTSAN